MERVIDELAFLAARIPFKGRAVLDIGCGAGAATRKLVTKLGAARAVGLEVDEAQVRSNSHAANHYDVSFAAGRAEELPFENASFDIAMMQKSFHHVPIQMMNKALDEAARVLDPKAGILIVSEPVAAGPFDEIMRNFHDEHVERAEAQRALSSCNAFGGRTDLAILAPVDFPDFSTFRTTMMRTSVIGRETTPAEVEATRRAYEERSQNGRLSLWREFSITILRIADAHFESENRNTSNHNRAPRPSQNQPPVPPARAGSQCGRSRDDDVCILGGYR